jgi:hypothetical protein
MGIWSIRRAARERERERGEEGEGEGEEKVEGGE